MSDAPAPRSVSLADMSGRIGEAEAQRDAALARCVRLAGEKAEAIDLVHILKAEVDRLTAELRDSVGGASSLQASHETGSNSLAPSPGSSTETC